MKLLYFFVFVTLLPFVGSSQTNPNPESELSGEQISDKIINSVVTIIAHNGTIRNQGSGVVMPNSNYIVTNSHVVNFCDKIMVKNVTGEFECSAQLYYQDEKLDLAILKISSNTSLIPILISEQYVRQGSTIYAMGTTDDIPNLLTKGIVSLRAKLTNGNTYLIHDASSGSGSSGGALINTKGELVGITCGHHIPNSPKKIENINFAIPVDILRKMLEEQNILFILSASKYRIKVRTQ